MNFQYSPGILGYGAKGQDGSAGIQLEEGNDGETITVETAGVAVSVRGNGA